MKSNKIKDMLDNIEVSKDLNDKILSKTVNKEKLKKRILFRLSYVCVIVFLLIIGIIGTNALIGNITKNYKIETIKDANDNLPLEERNEKHVLFDNKIDKEYESKLFKKDKQYTYKEIEERLQLKILKNKNFNSNIYQIADITAKDDKIAKLIFAQIKPGNGLESEKYLFGFEIITKYNDEDNTIVAITHGGLEGYIEHYIKSLNTMALIDKPKRDYSCGPTYVYFSYNDVVYILYFNIVCFNVLEIDRANSTSLAITESELYDFLEAFTLD